MKKIFLSIVVLPLLVAVNAWARTEEVRIGNGGDALAAQFIEVADDMVQLVETMTSQSNVVLPEGLNFEMVASRIKMAKVFSANNTYLPGNIEVDALNFPAENRIVFGRERFQRLIFNLKAQRTLVMHEYMGLAGVDDSTYRYSTFLTRKTINGGDKGELWLLKDLLLPGFQNPFKNVFLEFSTQLFVSTSPQTTRNFQSGNIVSNSSLDKGKPYCVVTTGSFQNSTDPGARSLRVGIGAVLSSGTPAGADVELKMARVPLVPKLTCTNSGAGKRVSLKDMLDSFGGYITFSHDGSSSLGNIGCTVPVPSN